MLKSIYLSELGVQEITFPKMALCFGVALLLGLLIKSMEMSRKTPSEPCVLPQIVRTAQKRPLSRKY